MPSNAVYDGRFQPLHIGHVAVMKAIRKAFGDPLTVVIIGSLPNLSDGAAADYSREVDKHHAPARNPLTWFERYTLLSFAIAGEPELAGTSIIGVPRPDLYWQIARHFYPDNRYICVTDKDDYERAKVEFWTSLGEQTRVIPSAGITKISATEVKFAMKSGRDYVKYLPPQCLDYFQKIDGPSRFMNAEL
jgi:cytidyltransferase-like protein